ncbi:MAG: T9SS type A sorting domain-containing protein [Flavobacteriales bacterium]|nr:T9SS type A sorting domain-containing protein [Flavobacteriales bacterium]
MKKTLLFLCVLGFVGTLKSQTITPDMFNPTIGSYTGFITITDIDPLGGGEQTWDFSNEDQSDVIELNAILPSNSPYPSEFASSDFILVDSDGGANAIQSLDNSVFITGYYDQDSIDPFINPWEILRFPMNFGDTWTDIYSDAQAEQELPGGLVGNSVFFFDAFGTLILHNSDVIENVARVKAETEQIYYTSFGPIIQNTVNYWWYAPGFDQPIAWYVEVGEGGNTFGTGQVIQPTLNVDEFAPQSLVKAYPNPAGEEITIEIDQPKSVELVTLSGVKVEEWNIEQTTTLSLSGVASGAYLLRVIGDSSSEVIKVMIR